MKKVRIERLDLDVRGVPPAVAQAAARQLGPALARALTHRHLNARPTAQLDAGRLVVGANPGAAVLAHGVAKRIADKTSRG